MQVSVDTIGGPATSLLRSRNFLNFWTGQTISQLGAQLGQLAFPVLAVSILGATEFQVGALNAAGMAAFLVVGLPAGAWVDRWIKRRVMIIADLVRMAAMLLVPVLWWLHQLQIWHLYVVAAVVGVATVFFDVSYQSFVPILVPTKQVADANSKLDSTSQISRVGGPALGGFLLTLISAPLLFVGESLGYLASALFLHRTRDEEQPHAVADRRPLAVEIKEGLAFVAGHPLIRRIVTCTAGLNFFAAITITMLPVLILRDLDLGAAALGIIMSVGSVGGVLGALCTPWLARRIGEGTLIPLAAMTSTCSVVLIPVADLSDEKWISLAVLVVSDFCFNFAVLAYNIMQVSMRQRVCPPRLLGRMNASIRFIVFGVMPLSALISGVLGQWLGLLPTLWIGALGGFLAVAVVFFSPLRGMRKLPDTVHGGPESVEGGPDDTGEPTVDGSPAARAEIDSGQ